MLEEILKSKLEKDEGTKVVVTEETSKEEESSFKSFMDNAGVAPEKKEEEQVKAELETKTETDDSNKDSDNGSDVFDFSNKELDKEEKQTETKVDFNLTEKFKELYPDLEVEDVAQLVAEYKELKSKKPLLGDDELSKVASLLVDGEIDWNKIKEIAEVKTLNVNDLTEREIYIRGLKKEGYSDSEIKDELEVFDSAFNFDEEDSDQREMLENKRLKSSLRKKIKDYKEDLSRLKDDAQFDLPKLSLGNDNTKSNEEAIKKQEEMLAKWNNVVKSNVNDFKEVVFNLDKDKKYNFKVTEEDLSFLEKSITDSAELYKMYQNKENNTFDFKSMRQDLFMMKNWKTVVKALVEQNANNKAEKVIKEISNIDFDGSQKGSGGKTASPKDLAIQKLLGI